MVDPHRIVATVVYILSIIATLLVALKVGSRIPPHAACMSADDKLCICMHACSALRAARLDLYRNHYVTIVHMHACPP